MQVTKEEAVFGLELALTNGMDVIRESFDGPIQPLGHGYACALMEDGQLMVASLSETILLPLPVVDSLVAYCHARALL